MAWGTKPRSQAVKLQHDIDTSDQQCRQFAAVSHRDNFIGVRMTCFEAYGLAVIGAGQQAAARALLAA